MDIFHTSPTEITEITKSGRFGGFLFFAATPYVMTAASPVVYRASIEESEIINAGSIFYHEDADKLEALVAELADRFEISEDDARELIDESKSIYDIETEIEPEDLADASWDVQAFTARAAQILGFRGVCVKDEQGSAYMIDMCGRESELEIS